MESDRSSAINSQIEKYLQTPTVALQDWYSASRTDAYGSGTIEAMPPGPEEIKKRFAMWIEKDRSFWRKLVCDEWGYERRSKTITFQVTLSLATSLAEFLVHGRYGIPAPIATALVLVQFGFLDELCKSKQK